MTSKQIPPPRFGGGTSYAEWKNKLDMWISITEVPKEKQAILVRLQSLDGNNKAEKKAIIPVQIGRTLLRMEVEIVNEENLPLLLSKSTLKRAGTILDMQNDRAVMLKQDLKLHLSTNGHYAVDILPKMKAEVGCRNEILASESTGHKEFGKAEITKLHKQFGHASQDKLKKLIQNAGKWNADLSSLIEETVSDCEICKVYKKPSPRPVVGLSWANDFNQTVAVDLHQLGSDMWYLHMIDHFTRYSRAAIVRNKFSSTIVKKFMQNWIGIFGSPARILSDNGGEFDSEVFKDMCGNFNITFTTTAAYSPWSNGLCERHNRTLTETLMKVKAAEKCDMETALAWAVSAKNSLVNNNGFSPNQLVFGRNPTLPSVTHDDPPALEGESISLTVANNIFAMQAARKAVIESESSEKIRRALRTQTRQTRDEFFTGEEVYYKREDQKRWKGPAKVIGQDGPVIFIRHGGQLIRAHSCRVQHANRYLQDFPRTKEVCIPTDSNDGIDASSNGNDYIEDEEQSVPEISNESNDSENMDNDQSAIGNPVQAATGGRRNLNLTKGKIVSFTLAGEEYEAKILSRAGKSTGKYGKSYNVEYCNPESFRGKSGYVDFDKVENLNEKEMDENTHEDVLVLENVDFLEAKKSELKSWRQNKVYNEVENVGQPTISVRWVCSMKDTEDGIIPKARLVARGFEEQTDDIAKESPTCSKDSLRVLIAIVAQKKWKLHTIDIKTAFLQGNCVDREIFLKPPKEAGTTKLWKLNKCVYGLSDASLKWYNRLKKFLVDQGAKVSASDSAVFYVYCNGELQGIAGIHVDDILWSGTEYFENNLISKLRSTFLISSEKNEAFKYLGLDIQQSADEILINQELYVKNLETIKVTSDDAECLSSSQIDILRANIGRLLWASNQTRPDVSYDVCQLASNLKDGKKKDLLYINKIIRRLKNQQLSLKYKNLGNDELLKIVVFADAAYGNLRDGGSQGGNLVFLVGENNECSLLSWQSKRIRRVAKSTLTAETLSLSDAVDNAVFIKDMFAEIYFGKLKSLQLDVITDNRSLCEALRSSKNVSNKRLRVEIGMLKEMIQNKEINSISWVESKKQLADVLTKKGASPERLVQTLTLGQLRLS
ncbi:uncharacterized protein LOC144430759 [Styela clava]